MRKWFCLALAATSIGCSGGRDPVQTVGGNSEYAGPGAPDYFDPGGGPSSPTTSLSLLVALCIKACAHVRAKDCEGEPAHTADQCENDCKQTAGNIPASCADESAAVYACTIDAKITCSDDFAEMPEVNGCDSKSSDLQKCIAPGSNCVISGQTEDFCFSQGLPTVFICSDGISPSDQCFQLTGSLFCCP